MMRDGGALVFWCEKGFFCGLWLSSPAGRSADHHGGCPWELGMQSWLLPNTKSMDTALISDLAHPYQSQGNCAVPAVNPSLYEDAFMGRIPGAHPIVLFPKLWILLLASAPKPT